MVCITGYFLNFSFKDSSPLRDRTNMPPDYAMTSNVCYRPGAILTPESESNDDSDSDSGVGIGVGIICSSFWWSRNRSRNRGDWNRNRSRNRGDWNRSRNRGDWNRSWNRNQMTIPHIYVHVPSNIHSGSNPRLRFRSRNRSRNHL